MKFEQGPIRPPSEARSLLIRINRNCPWNRCTFCPVYKRRKFKVRRLPELVKDIEAMGQGAAEARRYSERLGQEGEVNEPVISGLLQDPRVSMETKTMGRWLFNGGTTVFLQDANAVLNRQPLLLGVLDEIERQFPQVQRITSYARAHTLARKSVDDLRALRKAGLHRIHMGLETGHDPLLTFVRKGTTAEESILAGQKVREAGIHLCFYVMPGLGGRRFSAGHAADTARVIRAVDPDRVRLRSLVLAPGTELANQAERGEFEPLDDEAMVDEIGKLLAGLEGCTGDLVSDHDLNLLMELRGDLGESLGSLKATVARFQQLPERERHLFMVGRRAGVMTALDDLADVPRRARAVQLLDIVAQATETDDLSAALQSLRRRMV